MPGGPANFTTISWPPPSVPYPAMSIVKSKNQLTTGGADMRNAPSGSNVSGMSTVRISSVRARTAAGSSTALLEILETYIHTLPQQTRQASPPAISRPTSTFTPVPMPFLGLSASTSRSEA